MSSPAYIKRLAQYSIQTAFSLDVIAFALEKYSDKKMESWLDGSKATFPSHKENSAFNGKSPFNSGFFNLVMESLCTINPLTGDDVEDTYAELAASMSTYVDNKTKSNLFGKDALLDYLKNRVDNGVLVPISMAVAYYCLLAQVDSQFYLPFLDHFAYKWKLPEDDRMTMHMIVFTIYNMHYEGWFCYEQLEALYQQGLVPPSFEPFLDELMLNAFEVEYLSKRCPQVQSHSYSQAVLANTLFYMTKISTRYDNDVMRTLPKDQLSYVLRVSDCKPTDAAFLFGAVCTASEQNEGSTFYPLTTKQLRENSVYTRDLVSNLKFIL